MHSPEIVNQFKKVGRHSNVNRRLAGLTNIRASSIDRSGPRRPKWLLVGCASSEYEIGRSPVDVVHHKG
jgi:hypothetical protein